MQTQIGQVTTGTPLGSVAAPVEKEKGQRPNGDAPVAETFQSVLTELRNPETTGQRHREQDESGETGLPTEEEASTATPSETEQPDDLGFENEGATVPSEEATQDFVVAAGDQVQDEGQDRSYGVSPPIGFKSDVTLSITPQSAESAGGATMENRIPAWLMPSASGGSGQNSKLPLAAGTALANGAVAPNSVEAAKSNGTQDAPVSPATSLQANTARPDSSEFTSKAAKEALSQPGSKTADQQNAPGLQVKANMVGRDKPEGAKTAGVAPGHAAQPEEPTEHLRDHHRQSDNSRDRFRTGRTADSLATAAAKPSVSSQANPLQAAVRPTQGVETSESRWVSEAGFSIDVVAQDAPATSRLQQTALLQQPDLPRNVAAQLAQAMRQGGADRPMELVLNPAELGRVRISMQAQDGAMTVHVLADRPETLDLMRRHIDTLAQEFHDIGFGTAEFAFGQNTPEGEAAGNGGTFPKDQPHSAASADGETAKPSPVRLALHSDRVDVRL